MVLVEGHDPSILTAADFEQYFILDYLFTFNLMVR
jgi:hypothetical protein